MDDGIPLSMCLRKFSSWLKRLRDDKGIVCANDKNTSPGELSLPDRQKVAAMVTWSGKANGIFSLIKYNCYVQ